MQKLLLIVGTGAVALGGLAALALFSLPVTPLFGERGPAAEITPVEAARPAGGRALIDAGGGTDVLRWRWCPARGITVFCFRSSGYSGFFQGEIAISFLRATIDGVRFSGLRPGALGVSGFPAGAALSGELNNLVIDWRDGCLHRSLISSRGEVRLSGMAAGGAVAVEGDGKSGVDLRGQAVSGHLALAGNRIAGVLRLAIPGESSGEPVEINVTKSVSCL